MKKPSWKLYKAELKAASPEGDRHNRSTDRLEMSGYWRLEAARTKADFPVAIWTDENRADMATIFQIGRKVRNTHEHPAEWEDFVKGSWLSCVAVSEEEWHRAHDTGFWGDGKPARTMSTEEKLGIDVSPGDNNAPIEETLQEQIEALVAKAKAFQEAGISTKEQADAATVVLEKLRLLLKKAEEQREREKEPHLEAGRAVDAKWKNIREPGIDAGKALAASRDAWLREEQRKADEAARIENERRRQAALEEARKEAERQREEARKEREALQAQAESMGMEVDAEPEAEEELEIKIEDVYVPEVKAEKVTVGGGFTRNVSARKVRVARVTDAKLLLAHLVENNDEELTALLQKRANAAMRAKLTLPGVTISEE